VTERASYVSRPVVPPTSKVADGSDFIENIAAPRTRNEYYVCDNVANTTCLRVSLQFFCPKSACDARSPCRGLSAIIVSGRRGTTLPVGLGRPAPYSFLVTIVRTTRPDQCDVFVSAKYTTRTVWRTLHRRHFYVGTSSEDPRLSVELPSPYCFRTTRRRSRYVTIIFFTCRIVDSSHLPCKCSVPKKSRGNSNKNNAFRRTQ